MKYIHQIPEKSGIGNIPQMGEYKTNVKIVDGNYEIAKTSIKKARPSYILSVRDTL